MTDPTNAATAHEPRGSPLVRVAVPVVLALAVATAGIAAVLSGGDERVEATVPSGTILIVALDQTVTTETGPGW